MYLKRFVPPTFCLFYHIWAKALPVSCHQHSKESPQSEGRMRTPPCPIILDCVALLMSDLVVLDFLSNIQIMICFTRVGNNLFLPRVLLNRCLHRIVFDCIHTLKENVHHMPCQIESLLPINLAVVTWQKSIYVWKNRGGSWSSSKLIFLKFSLKKKD